MYGFVQGVRELATFLVLYALLSSKPIVKGRTIFSLFVIHSDRFLSSFWLVLQYFGLNEEDLPAYVIQNEKGKKFIKQNVEAEQLAPWLEDFLVSFSRV
jgi:hypothetical protein